ncbi:hypothetical protein DSECCO2_595490 [anaerobic digester metagenome]
MLFSNTKEYSGFVERVSVLSGVHFTQLIKTQSSAGVAVTVTCVPKGYHPPSDTVPPYEGFEVTLTRCQLIANSAIKEVSCSATKLIVGSKEM